jgi:hypothetical protein
MISCKFRFLSLLLDRLGDTGKFVVFGDHVEALKMIADGLATRFDWEIDQEILYIDGKISQTARRDRCGSSMTIFFGTRGLAW